ncbi:sucrose-6-phosphate hydrolase [Sphingomonas sp. VNH70]|uniref:sucrose-6-phosphate hydrolase n=1 Tax=Sphingomonas silueang TaxID=3156617 RepID=UPI0032B3B609
MTRPIIFTDCDDTLFQTARKCPGGETGGLKCMSTLVDGAPSGFATARQETFLAWLQLGTVIPVTARSREVLRRVDIVQAPAVCSNGGLIVKQDGNVDQGWHDHLATQAEAGPPVAEIYRKVTAQLPADEYRHWIVSENGFDLYIVIKSNRDAEVRLSMLGNELSALVPASWRRHTNGNNLAFLPRWLSKRDAVAYLIDNLRDNAPDAPVIGVGDSHSDAGFMDLCDFAIAPTNSQLWKGMIHSSPWVG